MQSAQDAASLAEEGAAGNPIMSQACLAAIALSDALTIKYAGIQNTGDHGSVVAAVRHAMGNRAEPRMMQLLARILSQKNQIQYAARISDLSEARRYLDQVLRFREWAEPQLAE
ncbi:hypothetical protein ACFL4Y_00155 [Gemmatimonadota bacterium]